METSTEAQLISAIVFPAVNRTFLWIFEGDTHGKDLAWHSKPDRAAGRLWFLTWSPCSLSVPGQCSEARGPPVGARVLGPSSSLKLAALTGGSLDSSFGNRYLYEKISWVYNLQTR